VQKRLVLVMWDTDSDRYRELKFWRIIEQLYLWPGNRVAFRSVLWIGGLVDVEASRVSS